MNIRTFLLLNLVWAYAAPATSQNTDQEKDSIYIQQYENQQGPDKVLHAEPLYIDLIRDLGARKGEKEWNVGLGLTDNLKFDSYEALIEYEWAPIDRLGLEVELPFTFYSPVNGTANDSIPAHRLNSLKVAAQWSFFVSEPTSTSMAIGYINEFEISDFFRYCVYVFFIPFLDFLAAPVKHWSKSWNFQAYENFGRAPEILVGRRISLND